MKISIPRPALTLLLPLATSLSLGFMSNACKPREAPSSTTENTTPEPEIPEAQRRAEAVIANDPNVELVEVVGDKMRIRNKYTKRSLTLPFQMIIDGQYPMIQEDKAMAERILKIRAANAKKTPATHLSLQPKGWGKTPAWIPRYPGLELSPTKMHTPREDGSIWGNISGTHTDSVETMKETLVSEFKKSGLVLTRRMAEKNTVYMIFETIPDDQDDTQEKRKVTCTISKRGDKTRVSMQYAYGMK